MSGPSFIDYYERLKCVNPIIDVAVELGVDVGRNNMAVCFMHDEKNSSLKFSEHRQRAHCFGCGRDIDVIDLVQEKLGLDHRDARDWLAERVHMEPMRRMSEAEKEQVKVASEERKVVFGMLTRAAEYYHSKLPDEIRAFLKNHYGLDKVVNGQMIGFSIGRGLGDFLASEGYSENDIASTGLFWRDKVEHKWKEMFQNRIVFPYWHGDSVVYMTARKVDWDTVSPDLHTPSNKYEEAKYKKLLTRNADRANISEHIRNGLYNPGVSSRDGYAILTEGTPDCLIALEHGLPAVSLNTTKIKRGQEDDVVRIAKRVGELYICFDSEENEVGITGALDVAELLEAQGAKVYIIQLPRDATTTPHVDLNEYFMAGHSVDDFLALKRQATTALDVEIERFPEDMIGVQFADKLQPVLEKISRRSELEWDIYLDRVKARFKLSASAVKGLRARVGGIKASRVKQELLKSEKDAPDVNMDTVVLGVYDDNLYHWLCNLWFEYRETKTNIYIAPKKIRASIRSQAEMVFQFLAKQGAKFFYNPTEKNAFFAASRKDLYFLDHTDDCFRSWWMNNVRQFTMESLEGKELLRGVEHYIAGHDNTQKVTSSMCARWDRHRELVYFNLCNDDNEIIRIRPAVDGVPQVDILINGANEDNIALVPATLMREPITIDRSRDFDDAAAFRAVFDALVGSVGLTEAQKRVSVAFDMSQLIPDKTQCPIKHHIGNQGSGKTSAAQAFAAIVYGDPYQVSRFGSERELWALASVNPYVAQDDAELRVKQEFSGFYKNYATGQPFKIRKLYTTASMIEYRPRASFTITSVGDFETPEELSRVVSFTFDSRYWRGHVSRDEVFERAMHARPLFWTLLFRTISRFLAEPCKVKRYLERLREVDSPKDRFNDSFSMMMYFHDYIYRATVADSSEDATREFISFVEDQRQEYNEAVCESDPIFILLDLLIIRQTIKFDNLAGLKPIMDDATGHKVVGAEGLTSAFYTAFLLIQKKIGMRESFAGSTRQLGIRLKNLQPTLEANGWKLKKFKSGGQKYKIWYEPLNGSDDDGDASNSGSDSSGKSVARGDNKKETYEPLDYKTAAAGGDGLEGYDF